MAKRKTKYDKFKKKMLNEYVEKYEIMLEAMSPEDFCNNYHKSMEYIMPKLQRTQFNSTEEKDLTINVNYKKSIADEELEEANLQSEGRKEIGTTEPE